MVTIELTNENLKNFQTTIKYLLESEKQSYEEFILNNFEEFLDKNPDNLDIIFNRDFYNQPEINHIYALARKVSDAIDFNLIENSK